jgi:hypothetical protein
MGTTLSCRIFADPERASATWICNFTVRGLRFIFTEEPVQGFAAPGCCDGVAEAAETFRRAKFQRYGRDCALTFGRFPSSWQ